MSLNPLRLVKTWQSTIKYEISLITNIILYTFLSIGFNMAWCSSHEPAETRSSSLQQNKVSSDEVFIHLWLFMVK